MAFLLAVPVLAGHSGQKTIFTQKKYGNGKVKDSDRTIRKLQW